MESIKVLIIDDEIYAQNLLETLIDDYPGSFEVVAKCSNLLDGVDYIKNNPVNLIFLDVEMPIDNGTKINDFLTRDERPDIIFVTAYDSFAIDAIRLGAFDYIVKPVDRNMFKTVLNRYLDEKEQLAQDDTLSIVTHKGTSLVKYNRILFLSASGSYSEVVTGDKKFLTSKPLKYFDEKLPLNFIRIHRSYIVNKDNISGLVKKDSNWWISFKESSEILPISRKYSDQIEVLTQ